MELPKSSVGSVDSVFYLPAFLSPAEQDYFWRQVNSAPVSKWKSLKNRRLQNWGRASDGGHSWVFGNSGGVVHEKGLIAQPLPQWLASLTQRISSETGFFPAPINHVLVNEYKPGQGIMPHQDGPLYFPVVAIVSLGSPTLMRFFPHQSITEAKEGVSQTSSGEKKLGNCSPSSGMDGVDYTKEQPSEEQITGEQADGDKHATVLSQGGQQQGRKDFSLILMPGSLLIFKDSVYDEYLHGIEDCFEHIVDDTVVNVRTILDQASHTSELLQEGLEVTEGSGITSLRRVGTRISLTCRLISKVQGKFFRL